MKTYACGIYQLSKNDFICIYSFNDINYIFIFKQTDKCINVIEGHCDEVSVLVYQGRRLWSGSLDRTIRNWTVEDLKSKSISSGIKDQSLSTSVASAAEKEKLSATKSGAKGANKNKSKAADPVEIKLSAEEEAELAELMDMDD